MDVNWEEIKVSNTKNQISNLNDWHEQIKNRILADFIIHVKKTKLSFWAKYSLPAIFVAPFIGSIVFYLFFSFIHHYDPSSLLNLSWFMLGVFAVSFPLIGVITNLGRTGINDQQTNNEQYINPYKTRGLNIKNYFKGYLNFEKELKKYFFSYDSPLENENEIIQYMIDKSDRFFCKKSINSEYIKNICELNDQEIKKINDANLTHFQKQILINKINQNQKITLLNLEEIMQFSNIGINEAKITSKEIKEKLKKLL